MGKQIVINYGDGTVGIFAPSPEYADKLEEIKSSVTPDGKTSRITDIVNIPTDKTFRSAWTDDLPGNKVRVDMSRARDIHMNRIRKVRDKKLQELDIETMRGNDVQSEKQILRDLPDNTDLTAATTPEELKTIWPEALE